NPDSWDGYKASRQRVLNGIAHSKVRNPVVLTGDVHQHYAADLKTDFEGSGAPVVASELVATSVTSGGGGTDTPTPNPPANPGGKVKRDPPRLRPGEDGQEGADGRLPLVAVREDAGRAGHDRGELRARGRAARPPACLTPYRAAA